MNFWIRFHISIYISICRLDNALTDVIVTMIINTFPSANTYYIPPIAKKDSSSNKSIPARGKLMSTCRNQLSMTKCQCQ